MSESIPMVKSRYKKLLKQIIPEVRTRHIGKLQVVKIYISGYIPSVGYTSRKEKVK